jgi:hypothetical protein
MRLLSYCCNAFMHLKVSILQLFCDYERVRTWDFGKTMRWVTKFWNEWITYLKIGSWPTIWNQTVMVERIINSRDQIMKLYKRWLKPDPWRYKCNIDASFPSSQNKVGIDMCIHKKNRSFVLAKTLWLSPLCFVEVGEALWLYLAILWVSGLQLDNMDFTLY